MAKNTEMRGLCPTQTRTTLPTSKTYSLFLVDKLGGVAILWFSIMEGVIAMSTTEAEYMEIVEVAKEIIMPSTGIHAANHDGVLHHNQGDNEDALRMTDNLISGHRTKHIDMKFHFIRKTYLEAKIDILHVRTDDQRAKMLKAALDKTRFPAARQ
ncbi:unnamed protein product, partial [Discosporangium mesarthrocarpum]